VLRWGTIVTVARQLGMDVRVAVLLAADCAAAGPGSVRLDIKGPPYRLLPSSAILTSGIMSNSAGFSTTSVCREYSVVKYTATPCSRVYGDPRGTWRST
jgi:hypothetical protein